MSSPLSADPAAQPSPAEPAEPLPRLPPAYTPGGRAVYPADVPQMHGLSGNTLVPLATVLYVMALDVPERTARNGLAPPYLKLVMSRTWNPGHISDNPLHRASAARHPDGAVQETQLLRLSRYMHIGVPLSHPYYAHHVHASVHRGLNSIRVRQGTPAPDFQWDDDPPLGDFQDPLTGNLRPEALHAVLSRLRLSQDWTEVQDMALFNPMYTHRYMPVHAAVCQEVPHRQCVIWMPTLHAGNARPLPPFGAGFSHQAGEGEPPSAVAVVVNNDARSNADLIDLPASLAISGAALSPAVDSAVHAVVERILSWLELVFCGDSPAARQAMLANKIRRGVVGPDGMETVQRQTNIHVQLRKAERSGDAVAAGMLKAQLRRTVGGRPPKAMTEDEQRAKALRAAVAELSRRPKSELVAELLEARAGLSALAGRLEALRTDVSAFADLLDSLGDAGAALALRKVL